MALVTYDAEPEGHDDVPWALQVVVRVERDPAPQHLGVLRATASAVVLALDTFTGADADEDVRARTERWRSGPIRKVVRRARGAGWTRQLAVPGVFVRAASDGAGAEVSPGVDVAVHVPGRVDEVHPEVARLQVGGLTLEDTGPVAAADAPVELVLNPHVPMTTGKAAAQVGHAAQLVLESVPVDVAAGWVADGAPVRVRPGRTDEWDALLAAAPVVVQDGGFTEVEPGTVTVVATHPW